MHVNQLLPPQELSSGTDNTLLLLPTIYNHIPIEADYWGYDVADYWVREAITGGYMMSYQVIYRSKIGGRRVSDTFGWHIGCLTIIKGDIYFIDTYPPYDITYIGSKGKMPTPRKPYRWDYEWGKGGKPKK